MASKQQLEDELEGAYSRVEELEDYIASYIAKGQELLPDDDDEDDDEEGDE